MLIIHSDKSQYRPNNQFSSFYIIEIVSQLKMLLMPQDQLFLLLNSEATLFTSAPCNKHK